MIRFRTIIAAGAILAGSAAVSLAGSPAHASTASCDAVLPHGTCASWQSEVPGRPDLDVLGGGAVSGNSLIVYKQSSTDKAEDFRVINVNAAATSKYTVNHTMVGGHDFTAGVTLAPTSSVMIEFSPNGVPSGLCVSTVNPDGFAAAQLRGCSNGSSQFNPFQTFTSAAAAGDGTFVQFHEVINNLAMTNPKNDGSIGSVGNRVHVTFTTYHGFTGQLWGQNNT